MTKRINPKSGDVVKIPLSDGKFGFGWVLKYPVMAFFDLRLQEPLPPSEAIATRPILFKLWVMKYAVMKGLWPVIGHVELPAEQLIAPRFFKADPLSGTLSTTLDGAAEQPATREECENLERAAVWDPEHVVSRLEDHFAGRPNKWVESLRLK